MSDHTVIVTPTKVFYRGWYGKDRGYEEREIELVDVVTFLWDTVEFRGAITLERLFEIVKSAPDEWEMILQENIEPLLEEIDKSIPEERDFEGMEYLELGWVSESDVFEGKRSFDLGTDFSGYGTVPPNDPNFTNAGYKPGESMSYGVEFLPVNEIKDFEVRLDPKVKVGMDMMAKQQYGAALDAQNSIDLGDKPFTVLDLFKGMFWELTFVGPPEERDVQFEELKETVDECKREFDSEEFLNQLESEDEKNPENPIDIKDWKSDSEDK